MPEKTIPASKGSKVALLILGSINAFLGGLVIIGWYLYDAGLIPDYTFITSMHFNAALAIFTWGLCFFAFRYEYH